MDNKLLHYVTLFVRSLNVRLVTAKELDLGSCHHISAICETSCKRDDPRDFIENFADRKVYKDATTQLQLVHCGWLDQLRIEWIRFPRHVPSHHMYIRCVVYAVAPTRVRIVTGVLKRRLKGSVSAQTHDTTQSWRWTHFMRDRLNIDVHWRRPSTHRRGMCSCRVIFRSTPEIESYDLFFIV